MDAGRAWAHASSSSSKDNAQEDAATLGIQMSEPDPVASLELWECHLKAWNAFLAISNQWRTVSHDIRLIPLGLDYSGAQAGLQLAGITIEPAVWEEVQVIEHGALDGMREART